ncbi:MAG TPA: hypothetical protein VK034_04270 [Enhygromyxa sp.]|nr:hypothetical protein [Enhygromyxa sp.]
MRTPPLPENTTFHVAPASVDRAIDPAPKAMTVRGSRATSSCSAAIGGAGVQLMPASAVVAMVAGPPPTGRTIA